MREKLLLSVVIYSLILGGCTAEFEKPALEDLGMVGVMGIDYIDQKTMKVSVAVPLPTKSKEKIEIYQAKSEIPSDAIKEMSTQSERSLVLSQLRAVLFSEEFARKVGLRQVVENLYRNPTVGSNVYLAVVKGKAEDIVKGKYKNKPEFNRFINDLLRPRRETAFHSFLTIHDFMYYVTNEVYDPNLPYLQKMGENIHISKVAIFKGDKMVGFLSQSQGKVVQALLDRNKLPDMKFVGKEPGQPKKEIIIVINFVKSDSTITSNGNLQSPVIQIKIKGKADLVTYTGKLDLLKREQRVKVKQMIDAEIKNVMMRTIMQLHKMGLETAGLAESLRKTYHGEWNKELGLQALKRAKYLVHVDIEIIGYGTVK